MTKQESLNLVPPRYGKKIGCHFVEIDGKTHKNCTQCSEYKELDQFFKRSSRPDGSVSQFSSHCKACRSAKDKDYRCGKPEEQKLADSQRAKEYYYKNRESIIVKMKIRHDLNREKHKKACKEYDKINREKNRSRQKKFYQENRETILAKDSERKKRNRESINRYYKEREDTNTKAKLSRVLRNQFRRVLKNQEAQKSNSVIELIGCTVESLEKHLESKFTSGMNWDNYGAYKRGGPMTWHIDHIKPCAAFDLTDPEQQRECFHYTNMQPLWAVDNITKGDKY